MWSINTLLYKSEKIRAIVNISSWAAGLGIKLVNNDRLRFYKLI